MKLGMKRGANSALRIAAVIALLTGPAVAQYAAPPVSQQPLPPPTQVPSAQVPPAQVPPQPPPNQTMQEAPPQPAPTNQYSSNELIDAGHRFFGGVSRGLAMVVEKAVSQWGLPNGYVLGEEAGGAFVGGLRYGDGTLYTKNAGDVRVFWQGPTLGFDAGADGARTMMLVYNLPRTGAIFDRFGGLDGSAYFIGGFGMTALTANNIVLVPIRSGVGLRLGANLGYLKFTSRPTWNPF
ncbi:MAG TPA: DUF1134 domain-containing protein [Xanthobacteraceae bacterium]|nr:DUF1134 domain-containing protein [Xanthobacteraceae bacterium]